MAQRVIDYAIVKGHRGENSGLNPARLKGSIAVLMPVGRRVGKHHEALPWNDVPELYARLREMDDVGAVALRLLILGALRQREVRELRWCDIREDRIVIPAER